MQTKKLELIITNMF